MRKSVAIFASVVVFGGVLWAGFWMSVAYAVDTPDYMVVKKAGAIEIRDYPALRVAEITRSGDRRQAVRAGFRPLASYIFAKNRPGDKIAMTAPVTQTSARGDWLIHFIMPEEYALKDLPKPTDGSVRLRELPPQRRIAIRFSGVQNDKRVQKNEATLRAWMENNNIRPLGEPTYAYYNDPFTPGPLRRNEVLFDIAQ